MNEPKPKQSRAYVVIVIHPPTESSAYGPEDYSKLGIVEAGDAEAACVAAMEEHGLPEQVTKCVAVPVGNWNACKVEEETRPRFTAKRMSAMPEKAPEADAVGGEPEPSE